MFLHRQYLFQLLLFFHGQTLKCAHYMLSTTTRKKCFCPHQVKLLILILTGHLWLKNWYKSHRVHRWKRIGQQNIHMGLTKVHLLFPVNSLSSRLCPKTLPRASLCWVCFSIMSSLTSVQNVGFFLILRVIFRPLLMTVSQFKNIIPDQHCSLWIRP